MSNRLNHHREAKANELRKQIRWHKQEIRLLDSRDEEESREISQHSHAIAKLKREIVRIEGFDREEEALIARTLQGRKEVA